MILLFKKIEKEKRREKEREPKQKELRISVPTRRWFLSIKKYIENMAKLGKIFPLCINKFFLACLIFGVHYVFIMEVLPDIQRHEGCTC